MTTAPSLVQTPSAQAHPWTRALVHAFPSASLQFLPSLSHVQAWVRVAGVHAAPAASLQFLPAESQVQAWTRVVHAAPLPSLQFLPAESHVQSPTLSLID